MPITCLTVPRAQGSDLTIGDKESTAGGAIHFSGGELWAQSCFQQPAHSVSSVISSGASITLKRPKQKMFKCHCADNM